MHSVRTLLAVLAVAAAILVPTPAQAATRYVYVDVAVASTWTTPMRDALGWVDRYTGSDMVFGRCRTGYKCVIIRERELCCDLYGWTAYAPHAYYAATDRATIYLDPSYRGQPDWVQKRMAAHELGHANGITWHNRYWCSGIMNKYIRCGSGVWVPYRFTAPQLDRLRVN